MSFSYVWPLVLAVACNVFYQIFAKAVPQDMDGFASLTVTYLVAAACAAVLFFVTNRGGSLAHEYGKLNMAPFLLGVVIVGLEFGFICAYKAGWPVSSAQLVQSAFLAVALIFVGALLYHEPVTARKVAGILVCLAGLWLVNG